MTQAFTSTFKTVTDTLVFSHANGFPLPVYRRLLDALRPEFDGTGVLRFGHDPSRPVTVGWPYLVDELTVDDLPTRLPAFDPESDQLGHYCQVLTQLLMARALPADMARVIEDLLGELVSFYADTLNAPRWINTPEGRVLIDDLIH